MAPAAAAAEEEEKCHMALLVLTEKRSAYGGGRVGSVWLCELTGREGGKRDVSQREDAAARCEEVGSSAEGVLRERKSLGVKTYNMGLVQVNVDDLVRERTHRCGFRDFLCKFSLYCRCTRRGASAWIFTEAPSTFPSGT